MQETVAYYEKNDTGNVAVSDIKTGLGVEVQLYAFLSWECRFGVGWRTEVPHFSNSTPILLP